jgi:hypothetical protein
VAGKTFAEGCAELEALVGTGELTGTVEVSQIYAKWIHEGINFHFKRGGQALYLQTPLMERYSAYLEDYAKTVLIDGGQGAFKRAVEDLSGAVAELAPVEFGNLRASGHPTVTDDGVIIYDRPPLQHRMTEEELRAERGLFNAPSIKKEHEAAWFAEHPGEPGGLHTPQSFARMVEWVFGHGVP